MDAFAKNIRYYRLKCKMSQSDLADKLSSRQTTVSAWERGLCTPSLATIRRMAEIFNISLNDLLYNSSDFDGDSSFVETFLSAFYTADASTREQVCHLLDIAPP